MYPERASQEELTRLKQQADEEARHVATGRLVAGQLADLAEMRVGGMKLIRRLADDETPAVAEGRSDVAFSRLSLAVRRIIVLEQEILDLRPLPENLRHWGGEGMKGAHDRLGWEEEPATEPDDPREPNDLRERNDLREPGDPDDYDHAPVDVAIARVREILNKEGAELPAPARNSRQPRSVMDKLKWALDQGFTPDAIESLLEFEEAHRPHGRDPP